MTSPANIPCLVCIHFKGVKSANNKVDILIYICPAFPRKIPLDIRSWDNPHTSVRDDQIGKFIFKSKSK